MSVFADTALAAVTQFTAEIMAYESADGYAPDDLAQKLYNATVVALAFDATQEQIAEAMAKGVPQ